MASIGKSTRVVPFSPLVTNRFFAIITKFSWKFSEESYFILFHDTISLPYHIASLAHTYFPTFILITRFNSERNYIMFNISCINRNWVYLAKRRNRFNNKNAYLSKFDAWHVSRRLFC